MINKDYLLEQPAPPGPVKLFFDQTVMPLLIDAAGTAEVAVHQIVLQSRERPIAAVGTALALGCGAGIAWKRVRS